MRSAIIVCAVCALVGLGAGWGLRGAPRESVRYVVQRVPVASIPAPSSTPRGFPERPKPPLDAPVPIDAPPESSPSPLVGRLPPLPNVSGGTLGSGLKGPLIPESSVRPSVTDLNADEALAKRTVIQAGGETVSTADAKDTSGKIGRTLVVETEPVNVERVRAALRAALHDRAVISDAGIGGGDNPELLKAQEALDAARKGLDKARADFLPQAPILRQMEDDYGELQRSVAEIRKRTARRRLNVMVRPGVVLP